MDFGINTFTRGATETRDGYMMIAQAADRLGFGFLSVNDHVVVPRDFHSKYPYSEDGVWAGGKTGHNFDQLATLCFLAGCTTRVRLMSSVMVVPHRQPVLAAKIIATADVLSGGRITLGVGAGWLEEEFEALETRPYDDRGRVTDEYIEAFRELWTKDDPKYRGQHVRFADILFVPKPIQKRLPVWVGGESPAARRRAANLGDAWYPGSLNPEFRLDTPARLGAAIAEVRGMAEKAGRDPKTLDMAFVVLSPVDWTAQKGHDSPRRLFTGSPADMAADAAALAKAGVRHINVSLQAGSARETVERMQRFAEQVMPLVGA
jgi:probable F420-dependent oxidoreductase